MWTEVNARKRQTADGFAATMPVRATSSSGSLAGRRRLQEKASSRLSYTAAVSLSLLLLCIAPPASCVVGEDGGKGPLEPQQTDAPPQDFFSSIEQMMRDWPVDDVSNELPLDEKTHIRIKRICDEIQRSTEQRIRQTSLPLVKISIRSMYYVTRGTDRYIKVSYFGKANTAEVGSESVFCDIDLEAHRGRLRLRPALGRQISPFADVMIPALRAQAESTLTSVTDAAPLIWPISEEVHDIIVHQTGQLLSLYLTTLKEYLEPSDGITGQIESIHYELWFEQAGEVLAQIPVTFAIRGTEERYLSVGVKLDYKAGKVRLKDLTNWGLSPGTEYVRDASDSAMSDAAERWIKGFAANDVFRDARVGPPFKWMEDARDLPDGIGRIVHLTRRNHPFLGEHDRKCRIELPDGRTRTFDLLVDGGSVTKTDISLVQTGTRQFIHLKDDDQTDLAIALDTLKLCSPANLSRGKLVLTFAE